MNAITNKNSSEIEKSSIKFLQITIENLLKIPGYLLWMSIFEVSIKLFHPGEVITSFLIRYEFTREKKEEKQQENVVQEDTKTDSSIYEKKTCKQERI